MSLAICSTGSEAAPYETLWPAMQPFCSGEIPTGVTVPTTLEPVSRSTVVVTVPGGTTTLVPGKLRR